MAIGSPVCSRSWLRYHSTARRTGAGPPSRSASDAERSSGSRIRHTSDSRCVQGRSAQSWANMPPRALTGASWWASPTSTVLAPAVGGGGEELAQIVGADHAGFVDDDHGLPVQPQGFVT